MFPDLREYAEILSVKKVAGELKVQIGAHKQTIQPTDSIAKLRPKEDGDGYYNERQCDENGFVWHVSAWYENYTLIGDDGSKKYSVKYGDQHKRLPHEKETSVTSSEHDDSSSQSGSISLHTKESQDETVNKSNKFEIPDNHYNNSDNDSDSDNTCNQEAIDPSRSNHQKNDIKKVCIAILLISMSYL